MKVKSLGLQAIYDLATVALNRCRHRIALDMKIGAVKGRCCASFHNLVVAQVLTLLTGMRIAPSHVRWEVPACQSGQLRRWSCNLTEVILNGGTSYRWKACGDSFWIGWYQEVDKRY